MANVSANSTLTRFTVPRPPQDIGGSISGSIKCTKVSYGNGKVITRTHAVCGGPPILRPPLRLRTAGARAAVWKINSAEADAAGNKFDSDLLQRFSGALRIPIRSHRRGGRRKT